MIAFNTNEIEPAVMIEFATVTVAVLVPELLDTVLPASIPDALERVVAATLIPVGNTISIVPPTGTFVPVVKATVTVVTAPAFKLACVTDELEIAASTTLKIKANKKTNNIIMVEGRPSRYHFFFVDQKKRHARTTDGGDGMFVYDGRYYGRELL